MTEIRPDLSIIVPTMEGREEIREYTSKKIQDLFQDTDVFYEILTVPDAPSCGAGWQRGSQIAIGKYLLFSADDIEPLPGFFEAGVHSVKRGAVPAARVMRPDGSLESGTAWEKGGKKYDRGTYCQVPFCSREQWNNIGPMVPIQYYSDNYFTERAAANGWPCEYNPDYAFIHHRPRGKRPGESEQMQHDKRQYDYYMRKANA